ncbi:MULTISPECIES: N-acetylmuramoyl-L-alanine amidase [unclassified Paludibacterium]|uniref:N-acetylmuramoyl-L-alanine amidase n=1 Tax=unclassified Paludibacterium TaxID=2618429 RepID=UPI001C04FE30|nr:N-acetylmuramoyl-L-alanine amidase [Paludibacterium sp. B53371]BEV72492.1 N-acetylmuramoyl-L-alanine amidase AmpDh3 [Paludibacterium sp. THUN1379]
MFPIDDTSYPARSGFNQRIRFLIIHYTALPFAGSVTALTRGNVSAHYLIPARQDASYRAAGFDTLRIFRLVREEDRAWHAGISHWAGRDNLNDTAIGIEIVNLASARGGVFDFPDYEEEQILALQQLATSILARYPDISPKHVVGHADVAYERKSDPGPKLPWQRLHQAGIGAWYEESVKQQFAAQFTRTGLPARAELAVAFKRYGYAAPASDSQWRSLLRAFQMHFRPGDIRGELDIESCAILYALNQRYSQGA